MDEQKAEDKFPLQERMSDDNNALIDKLVRIWKDHNVGFITPSSVSEIQRTFISVGSKASKDVIALYSKIGGMDSMENDALWRLWSLNEIIKENKEPSSYGILFSDHCIDCWQYRLRYETEERSSVFIDFGGKDPVKFYDGLDDFLAAYDRDPGNIIA